MKITLKEFLFIILNILFLNSSLAQTRQKNKTFSQKEINKNKVNVDTYHLWWHKNRWVPSTKDTLPYFVDDRNYKGIINYGVEFSSKDFRLFEFSESLSMHYLDIEFKNCKFRTNDSIVEIEGYVNGGWRGKGWNNTKNNIDIFIGEKIDTINVCYFQNIVNKETVETKWQNNIIDDYVALDTFPSFYFKNYASYRTLSKGRRYFKIKSKINKNSILAFGGRNCYSEIFEVGTMIFQSKKNKGNRKNKKRTGFKPILVNNWLVANLESKQVKEIKYYTYTKQAENYIIRKQYGSAKKTYTLLANDYKNIYARDVHNAMRCSILSRDFENAFFWGEKLAAKGVDFSYFKASIFNNLKKNRKWENFSVQFDSIYKEALSNKNINLKQQIEQLVDEDQADYGLENRKDPKTLYETTLRVTDKLIELLKKEGFPSEEKIGVYIKNDTTLISNPDYHVLITHALQQKPKNLKTLNKLLHKSTETFEYDSIRSPNYRTHFNSCNHIYKGNLYSSKSCNLDDLTLKKLVFKFKNPYNFIIHNNNFVITAYNRENPKEYDKYYSDYFHFVMKLTDDWEFYEK